MSAPAEMAGFVNPGRPAWADERVPRFRRFSE